MNESKLNNNTKECITVDKLEHVVGNSVFALETNLSCLRKRAVCPEQIEILESMQASLERIKDFIANG